MKNVLIYLSVLLLFACLFVSCGKKNENPTEPTVSAFGTTAETPDSATNEKSDESSNEKPGESSSEKPGESSNEKPGESSSEKPGESSNEKPGESSSEKPGESSSEKPGESSSEKPGESSSEKPSESTTKEPTPPEPMSYQITFHSNGGSEVRPIRGESGTVVAEPKKPSKDGMKFVCWCTDAALTVPAEFPLTLTGNIDLYAKWNTVVPIKQYLKELMDGYKLDPYSYIPETMRPASAVTDRSDLELSFADFRSVSSIPTGGFGEQWHMITDNLNQSMRFFRILQGIEGVTVTSVSTFNNWFDQNPADTAHHSFKDGIYNVTVDYDGTFMQYVLDYTASVPVFGEQSVQIAMSMNMQTREKSVRMQVGEANALTYAVGTDSYSFAICYLGVRTAYFTVRKNADGTVTGQINEHLTVSGVGTHSSADFYIDGDYVSAVGNKADGLIGFTGYISELYDATTGRMLGYEVRETLSKIRYDTLWFNLSDVSGLQSVKYQEKTDDADAAFFVNGRSDEFATKRKITSRRYDIEMRTQYFYVLSEDGESYEEIAIQIPMLFVQEENLDTLTEDIAEKNKGLTLQVDTDSPTLAKIRSDYATLVDAFIEHKDAMDEEAIKKIIGSKVTFD